MISLVECMICSHKSYLICCTGQTKTLYSICQACALEIQPSGSEECIVCQKSIVRMMLDLKQALHRESQIKMRSSFGQRSQFPNSSQTQPFNHFQARCFPNNYQQMSQMPKHQNFAAERDQRGNDFPNNMPSYGGLFTCQNNFNQSISFQKKQSNNNPYSLENAKLLNEAFKGPTNRQETIAHHRQKSGVNPNNNLMKSKYECSCDDYSDSFFEKSDYDDFSEIV